MTNEKENELIADAAVIQYATGGCSPLYDEDVLIEYEMTAKQMSSFLYSHNDTIDEVEERLFLKVVELVENLKS